MKNSVLLIMMVLLTSILAPAQQVWRVSCAGGPGVDFTDLQTAVDSVAPGDTVLVYYPLSGSCVPQRYAAPTITKSLNLVGISPGLTVPPPTQWVGASALPVNGSLRIQGIAAGERVTISNLLLQPGPQDVGLQVEDCAGQVVLSGMHFSSWGYATTQPFSIVRCADVVCMDLDAALALEPIVIEDSHVLFVGAQVLHSAPSTWPGGPPGYIPTTKPAMSLLRSDVTVFESMLLGLAVSGPSYYLARSVHLDESTLRVGPGAILRAQWSAGSGLPSWRAANPATCTVHLDPRALEVYPATAQPAPIPTAIDVTYNSVVVSNHPYWVAVAGPQNGIALALLGDFAQQPIATPFGSLSILPGTELLLGLTTLDASYGYADWYLQCPPGAPVGHPFVFQALTLSPTGEFGTTLPSPVLVAWEPGVIP